MLLIQLVFNALEHQGKLEKSKQEF